jgi:hypothetical protein
VWWFHRRWQGGGARFAWGYGVSAVGLTWLHLLNAPFVFAPMVVALARIVGTRSGQDARRWLTLACVCGIGLLIFVAPPFVLSPAALKEKAATDLPTLATWIGAAHQWLGTRDSVLVGVALAFAALGAREARRRAGEFGVYVCVGLGFTLLAIYLLQPAWVFNALTFARYLILFVPVLLLCAAVGVHRVAEIAVAPNVLRALLPAVLIAALFISGPLPKFFGAPQAYTNHGAHHFDVRSSHNLIAQATAQFPDSPLWKMLHRETISQKTIGYFPWSLLSYETDHPLVQARIGQTLLPVNAQGLCAPPLPGHPVPNSNVRLRNFVVLAHENAAPQVDYLVMRKPFTLHFNSRVFDHRYTEFSTCAKALRARYGEPLAEDTALAIYRVSRR